MTLPEEYGGSAMSMLDGVVVYTELGRALAPSPHFVSSVMSAGVLAGCRFRPRRRDEWLPKISAGEAIITPAWLEPHGGFGPQGVQLAATADGDGWRLDGAKRHVPVRAGGGPSARAGPHCRRAVVLPRRPRYAPA